jgi:hypothetical protein
MAPHLAKRSFPRMILIGLFVFSVLMITDYLIFGLNHATEMVIGAIGCGLAFALLARFGFY